MLSRLGFTPAGFLASLLFAPALLPLIAKATPIEALPDRVWTSRKGARFEARLIFYPRPPAPDTVIELLPTDPRQPARPVRIADLSAEDGVYLHSVGANPETRSSYGSLAEKTFFYGDGAPLTGSFADFSPISGLVTIETKEKPGLYWLMLEDLAPEARSAIGKVYLIPPRLETPLAVSHPLTASRSSDSSFDLKNMPMVKQVGSYCVPASATMIAAFHDINLDQRELAHLSSDDSRKHRGTYSGDMANAMESLGFISETKLWSGLDTESDHARFRRVILPFIRGALQQDGPLYVSFKPGVYGNRGHGCVVTGYNDHGDGEIHIHNPWGRREKLDYKDFSRKAREVVRFHMPAPYKGDSLPLEARAATALHRMPVDLTDAMRLLAAAGLNPSLRLYGRRDRRDDQFETQRWALAQGRRVIYASLERHPLLLVPATREGRIAGWYLLRKEQDVPAPLIRPRAPEGWREAARPHIDTVLNSWSTPVNIVGESSWDLPLIEIEG